MSARPLTVLVCALGGEGGGVLAQWLYTLAARSGHAAQATSIPGVAQRTGATTYYVEIDPRPGSALAARRPVFSLNPVPGDLDLLVSSELLETLRQVQQGMASAGRTSVLSSTTRTLTVAEKMVPGDGRVDDATLVATLQRHCREALLLDLAALARVSGTAVSATMFGAIAASGVLPFAREAFEDTIRATGKGVEASLAGFAKAYGEVVRLRTPLRAVQDDRGPQSLQASDPGTSPSRATLPSPAPASADADLRRLGRERVAAWQDEAYARLYDQRLARIDGAERAADAAGAHGGAVGRETARWLALWMAFDDIVQVARLKLSASRQARVRREVAARDDEIVKVFDHFKPGVPEFAALLPPSLAGRLQAWDGRRTAAGRAPWALPLRVGTHTVTGTLALRTLASLRGLRRRGSRFAHEQALIEQWLAAIERGLHEDWALGHELAQCGRLVKGYGSTNERGKANLLHITGHLAASPQPAGERALAIAAARRAALADEGGRALDEVLQAHGAPRRPVREQPVRFYKRRPGAA